jgi:hypothetical protein
LPDLFLLKVPATVSSIARRVSLPRRALPRVLDAPGARRHPKGADRDQRQVVEIEVPECAPGGALFLTLGWPSSHIKTMKDPNDSFNSAVLLLRHIGETHEWEITVTGRGEKPMSRFTFRGSRREADDMAIRSRLSAEVKLEATVRNVKARPSGEAALLNSQ